MIQIWYNDKFYAIQPEIDFVGLSIVNDNNPGFDTIPGDRFFNLENLKKRFNEILTRKRKRIAFANLSTG